MSVLPGYCSVPRFGSLAGCTRQARVQLVTVAVAVKVFDGIVLATDSATTLPLGESAAQVYNGADKLFHLHREYPLPSTIQRPDIARAHLVSTSLGGEPKRYVVVAKTGFAEALDTMTDEEWKATVEEAVWSSLNGHEPHFSFALTAEDAQLFVLTSEGWRAEPGA